MSNFCWRVLCCPSHSGPFKRRLPPIAESSRLSKRRKTFHGGDAEAHQRPTTSSTTQPDDRKRREDPFCREDRQERENPSDGFSFHQVFLSHSGSQKSFVEQLFVDLQREQISCFFDKDPQSLPKGEEFPPRIFEAALNCRVGVVVLSHEFISSKWPMLELCQFVRAKKNSPNGRPKILPVFFKLSPESLHQKLQDKDSLKRSWQELLKAQQRPIDLDEWLNALEALRPINGIVYNEQESEVDYRAKVVSSIRNLLPPVLRYDDSNVQGKERLCKEVARMFNNTPWGEDGVKIAGLYGVAGIGKTTLAKLACNFYSDGFDGRVVHVELGKGMAIERLKSALRVLTSASEMLVNSITDIEQGWRLFNNRMYGMRVFLALDNVSNINESMDEAKKYLRAVCSAGNQSMVLLTARSSIILRRFILEEERSCMCVPSLTEEEAVPILLEHTPFRVCNLSSEKQAIVKQCALKCYFSWHSAQDYHNHLPIRAYHPLALKAFGVYLYDSCPDLSRWIDIQNSSEPLRAGQLVIFNIFEESFQRLSEDYKNIFMFLCLYLPKSDMDVKEVYKWLALVCNTKVEHIKFAVNELHRNALVEMVMESCNRLYIHDLHMEFAENKADGTGKWISLKKRRDIPASLQENDRPRFSAVKFDNCHFECPGFVNNELFRNVLVLHLQGMPQLKILDLSPMRILRSITIVGCGDMQEIRGLKSLTSLVYFVVRDCSPNLQISGIERLVALQHLQMEGRLSETTTRLSPLSWASFPPMRSASFVGTIQLDRIGKGIRRLDLSACSKLRTIRVLGCNMFQIDLTGCLELIEIVIEDCGNLREISPLSHNQASLETRAICSTLKSKSLFRDRPAFPNLTKLCLAGLHNLGKPPSHIRWKKMHSFTELPALTGLTALKHLQLSGMQSLKELPALTRLTALEWLVLGGMHSLKELPAFTGLTALGRLKLEGMHSLKELPALTGLTALKWLQLQGMHSLKELPALTGLTALQWLQLEGMHSLKELPALTGLTALQWLQLQGMHSLKELPVLTGLTALGHLNLKGMHSLKELPALTELTALQWLVLKGMHSLKELPALTGLTTLTRLELEGMRSLNKLPAQLERATHSHWTNSACAS